MLPNVEIDLTVRDPDDAAVISAAVAGAADAIVSGDKDLHDDDAVLAWLAARGIEALIPVQLLAQI
jgi:predicted nucleic acid-binding protein